MNRRRRQLLIVSRLSTWASKVTRMISQSICDLIRSRWRQLLHDIYASWRQITWFFSFPSYIQTFEEAVIKICWISVCTLFSQESHDFRVFREKSMLNEETQLLLTLMSADRLDFPVNTVSRPIFTGNTFLMISIRFKHFRTYCINSPIIDWIIKTILGTSAILFPHENMCMVMGHK